MSVADPREELYRRILASSSPEAAGATILTLKVVHTANVLDTVMAQGLSNLEISLPAFNVLCLLEDSPSGSLSLSEIGRLLFTTAPNVTGLVDFLHKRGWVDRIPHPSDRRVKLAQLLPAGKAVVESQRPNHEQLCLGISEALTDAEQAQLEFLLDKWRLSLSQK